jgi:hypothetical protein
MADDLSDSLDSLRYAVARPGTFTTNYPETTDDMLLQTLMDGFAEAQLMGLLGTYSVDEDGFVSPALTGGQVALVVLFAAVANGGTTGGAQAFYMADQYLARLWSSPVAVGW